MASIAKLNCKQFRTMLKVAARGLHIDQAVALLRLRAATNLELLVDDVNTVLASCVFSTEREAIGMIVHSWKARGVLVGRSDAELIADARQKLLATDVGPIARLAEERMRRSPAMHDPAFRATLDVSAQRSATAAARAPVGQSSAAGVKRARSEGGPVMPAADGDGADAAALVDAASDATPGSDEGRAFKHALQVLGREFSATSTSGSSPFAPARYSKATAVFDDLLNSPRRIRQPNARSFVLLLYGALTAGDASGGRSVLRSMIDAGAATPETLYEHMQPAFLRRLGDAGMLDGVGNDASAAGVLSDGAVSAAERLLAAPPGSDKACFLAAAAAASRGDQFGSKHGAVLRRGAEVVSTGHNHRFGVPGECVGYRATAVRRAGRSPRDHNHSQPEYRCPNVASQATPTFA